MKKVLFIDEERSARNQYATELNRAGYKVFGARDWKAAVRVAQKEQPDCLVVEIEQLNLHGFGFIRSILAKSPATSVILTSSCHDERDEFSSWSSPAFVVKTSDVTALKATLDRATDRKSVLTA